MDLSKKNTEIQNIEHLFRKYYRRLCNVSNHIINDHDAAEDIVQNVFLKLLDKKENLQINFSIESYLIRSTSNASLNYLERSKRVVILNQSSSPHENISTDRPDQTLVYKELEQEVKKAIKKLPPKCRTIFALNRFEEMKYKEIARHLNISVKTVENQMGIALGKLREELRPYLINKILPLAIGAFLSVIFCIFSILILIYASI